LCTHPDPLAGIKGTYFYGQGGCREGREEKAGEGRGEEGRRGKGRGGEVNGVEATAACIFKIFS